MRNAKTVGVYGYAKVGNMVGGRVRIHRNHVLDIEYHFGGHFYFSLKYNYLTFYNVEDKFPFGGPSMKLI